MNPGHWQYWNDVTYAYGLLQWDDATNFLNSTTAKKLTPTDVNSMAGNNPKKLMDLQLKYFEKTMGGKYNTCYQTTSYYGCIKMSAKKYKKSKKLRKSWHIFFMVLMRNLAIHLRKLKKEDAQQKNIIKNKINGIF